MKDSNALVAASNTAGAVLNALRNALHGSSNTEALVLLPLIGRAATLRIDIETLSSAVVADVSVHDETNERERDLEANALRKEMAATVKRASNYADELKRRLDAARVALVRIKRGGRGADAKRIAADYFASVVGEK